MQHLIKIAKRFGAGMGYGKKKDLGQILWQEKVNLYFLNSNV